MGMISMPAGTGAQNESFGWSLLRCKSYDGIGAESESEDCSVPVVSPARANLVTCHVPQPFLVRTVSPLVLLEVVVFFGVLLEMVDTSMSDVSLCTG